MAETILDPCGSLGMYTGFLVEPWVDGDDFDIAAFDDESERVEILQEDIARQEVLMDGEAMTGMIDITATNQRYGPQLARGRFVCYLSPTEAYNWFQRLAGNTWSSGVMKFKRAPVWQPVNLLVKRDFNIYGYEKMYVDFMLLEGRSQVSGEDPQMLKATFGLIGKKERLDSGGESPELLAWPDPEPPAPDILQPRWLLGDSHLMLGSEGDDPSTFGEEGGTWNLMHVEAFRLGVFNNMVPWVRNSLEIQCIRSSGREVRLQLDVPHNEDTFDYYKDGWRGPAKFQFVANKNLEADSLAETSFLFEYLINERITASTNGRGEVIQRLNLKAKINPATSGSYVLRPDDEEARIMDVVHALNVAPS